MESLNADDYFILWHFTTVTTQLLHSSHQLTIRGLASAAFNLTIHTVDLLIFNTPGPGPGPGAGLPVSSLSWATWRKLRGESREQTRSASWPLLEQIVQEITRCVWAIMVQAGGPGESNNYGDSDSIFLFFSAFKMTTGDFSEWGNTWNILHYFMNNIRPTFSSS